MNISTGTGNSDPTQHAIDPIWTDHIGGTAGLAGFAFGTEQASGWVNPPTFTTWIDAGATSPPASDPQGTYLYQTSFTVPPGMGGLTLNLVAFAADNEVTFDLIDPVPNMIPIPGATLSGNVASNFSMLHSAPFTYSPGGLTPGKYTLQATVTNEPGIYPGTGNPSGLLVKGSVTCQPGQPCTEAGGVLNISTGTGLTADSGTPDPIWTVPSGPVSGSAFPVTPAWNWVAAPTPDQWIDPNDTGGGISDPEGIYVYETSFSVPSNYPPASFTLSFQFAADNDVTFNLSGTGGPINPIAGPFYDTFGALTPTGPFTVPNPTGTYTLQAVVVNSPPVGSNPTGLLVVGDVTCYPGARVGGTVSLLAGSNDQSASTGGSGPSIPYAAVAGGIAAAVLGLAAGGWYARRRCLE